MIIVAPIKLPTKISGSSFRTEFIPTDISPIDVKTPRIKKDIENCDIFKVLDNFSTDPIANPDPNQIPANDRM